MDRDKLVETIYNITTKNLDLINENNNLKNQIRIYKDLFLTELNKRIENDSKTIMDFNSDMSNVNH